MFFYFLKTKYCKAKILFYKAEIIGKQLINKML